MSSDYNPLLNDYDLKWMNDCVHEVLHSWHDHIIALIPLPEDRQKNFDPVMREFLGPIYFYKKILRAERVELVQSMYNGTPPDDIDYGRRDNGELMYAIPDDIPIFDDGLHVHGFENWKPDIFTIFDLNDGSGDKYYVRTIKERIGQRLLMMYRYDGTTPNGIDLKDIIVVEDEDSMNIAATCPLFRRVFDDDDVKFTVKHTETHETHDESQASIITDDSSVDDITTSDDDFGFVVGGDIDG